MKGSCLFMEGDQPLCLRCAGLEDLSFLPSGDSKLTRRAKKLSPRFAIVVKFSPTRKRYERQGLLVQKEALHEKEETSDLLNLGFFK